MTKQAAHQALSLGLPKALASEWHCGGSACRGGVGVGGSIPLTEALQPPQSQIMTSFGVKCNPLLQLCALQPRGRVKGAYRQGSQEFLGGWEGEEWRG